MAETIIAKITATANINIGIHHGIFHQLRSILSAFRDAVMFGHSNHQTPYV